MKQKKKKDEPPPPSAAATADEQQQQQQQQLCNGGDSAKKPKKSALKRTAAGGGGSSSKAAAKSGKNKRRVQFNESLNVFFESDYVIVIRDDDCDFDEEDFDFWSQQPCSCGDASCFQPWLEDDDGRGLPPLDPYEEQPGTLSPPDGYKDGCSRHVPPLSLDHLKYDDDLSTRYSSDAMDRCSDTHVAMPLPYNSTSYFEDNNQNARPELTLPPKPNNDEQSLQQPPSTNANAMQLQSKQNSICDKNNSNTAQQPRCIVETITMTTVTERQIVQETRPVNVHGLDAAKTEDLKSNTGTVPGPDDGYVLIKCGNNTVLYNNRNPNSAVRQLFPATKFVCPPTRIKETDDARLLNKYLITEESLRAFDSRSLNGGLGGGYKSDAHSDDDDDDTSNSLIRRTIERSTLRRNTAKKKNFGDTKEISLIEKIRRLTCDSDDDADDPTKKAAATRERVIANPTPLQSVSSDSTSQPAAVQAATPAYKKLADLFGGSGRYEQPLPPPGSQPSTAGGDPIGKPDSLDSCDGHSTAAANSRAAVRSAAGGKPFLSTLATACVTGNAHPTAASGAGTTAVSGTSQPSSQCPQPDVVAGTQPPGSHHRHEELAAFVQQDSGRLEKIRKRYMPPAAAAGQAEDEDDENDDYGFNRRPEVHGIRSGFSAQITIKNNQQPPPPPQRPRSYYGDPARQPPPVEVQPDFVPVYPAGMGVRARIQGDPRAPPPYPAASQRSIIRVTHGQQQQTIRVPYQAVGPVQVHLLTTATTAATSVTGHPPSQVRHPPDEYIVQHGHARIHHGQQFVIARGTQTAACISTTRYYQLPPPPPPNQQQQQLSQPQLPPPNFRPTEDGPTAAQFKQTSPTRGTASGRRAQQEFAVDHGDIPPSVPQAPKNPVLFYGMNV